MSRIVDIKEPAVQFYEPDIPALPVIHRDRYEREKRTILKRKQGEAVKLFQVEQRLQRDR